MLNDSHLIQAAKEAAEASFPCMSGFPVGAALLVEDAEGKRHVVKGSNYETQNYRSVCAEKHALQSAHLSYGTFNKPTKALKIAIFSPKHDEPIFPCGDCRQALFEANPDLTILCLGANGETAEHTAKDLLPHGFRLEKPQLNSTIQSPIRDYIVHFPVIDERLETLKDLQGLIAVGSPVRAAKLAEHFKTFRDWGRAKTQTYCHIVSGETDREYSLFTVEWPQINFKIGIASHGIGASGVEIVLSEISALTALASGTECTPLKAVIRSGTRGTLADVPLGTIALTTQAYSESSSNFPDSKLNDFIKQASKKLKIDLVEGACLSAQFFWSGQGRTPFPLLCDDNQLQKDHDIYLRSLIAKEIKWIEMEDYYLNYFAQKFGIASAAVGVAIAKRYDPKTDQFVLSYDAQTKKDREMLPAELALMALREFLS